ncbi:MAG: endonuclease/exonuclease/phosphatase family protein, partial [Micrococcales bacterium]|nr:endonuclease/exonuclease/phosphatase family protein [Micrococcales bacterium]
TPTPTPTPPPPSVVTTCTSFDYHTVGSYNISAYMSDAAWSTRLAGLRGIINASGAKVVAVQETGTGLSAVLSGLSGTWVPAVSWPKDVSGWTGSNIIYDKDVYTPISSGYFKGDDVINPTTNNLGITYDKSLANPKAHHRNTPWAILQKVGRTTRCTTLVVASLHGNTQGQMILPSNLSTDQQKKDSQLFRKYFFNSHVARGVAKKLASYAARQHVPANPSPVVLSDLPIIVAGDFNNWYQTTTYKGEVAKSGPKILKDLGGISPFNGYAYPLADLRFKKHGFEPTTSTTTAAQKAFATNFKKTAVFDYIFAAYKYGVDLRSFDTRPDDSKYSDHKMVVAKIGFK